MSKKEHILEKAEALFADKGYDATTIRDIAKVAQVNLAMISYYFGSKEKLIETLFERRMTFSVSSIMEIVNDQTLNAIEKLELIIKNYVNRVRYNKHFYFMLLGEQVTNKNKRVVQLLSSYKSSFIKGLEAVVQEGMEQKLFKVQTESVLLSTTISGILFQSLINKDIYAQYYGIKKDANYDEFYFDKIYQQLIIIVKSLLVYEVKYTLQ